MTERLHLHFSLSCIGEGNGNPLQCSCLENPSDGGAWWAAVHGVTQSWTGLKWLSSSSSCYLFLLFLLKFSWLTTICSFQAWNILIRHFYRLCTKVITMLLTYFQCYTLHIPMTYVFYSWKSVALNPFTYFAMPPPSSPLATTSLLSISHFNSI